MFKSTLNSENANADITNIFRLILRTSTDSSREVPKMGNVWGVNGQQVGTTALYVQVRWAWQE